MYGRSNEEVGGAPPRLSFQRVVKRKQERAMLGAITKNNSLTIQWKREKKIGAVKGEVTGNQQTRPEIYDGEDHAEVKRPRRGGVGVRREIFFTWLVKKIEK